jgi:uncharacterized protein (TIRG00374 family)
LSHSLRLIAKLAVTAAVIVFIIWKLGWDSIYHTIITARPDWLLAAIVLLFVSGWIGAIQWQIILKNRGIVLPFSRVFALYFIGMFFNNFALGAITGDAVKVAYLAIGDGKGKAGFAATFLDRFAGLWSMLGFAVLGSVLLVKQKTLESASMTFAVIGLAVTFVLFGGILLYLLSTRVQNLLYLVLDALPLWKKKEIKEILHGTVIEAHDLHILVPVALLTSVVQFMRIVVHILCAASLGLLTAANVHYFFIFVPLLALLMIVPLPFGIRESVGGTLFALAGFKVQAAIVMGFLSSLIGIAVSLLGGIYFVSGRYKGKKETT